MSEEKPPVRVPEGGIHADSPNFWTPKRINFRGFFTELSKGLAKIADATTTFTVLGATPAGAVAGWGKVFGSLPDFIAAIGNVTVLDEDDLACILVQRALARATKELAAENRSLLVKEFAKEISDQVKADAIEIILPPNFLQRPRDISLLRVVQPLFQEWLHDHGMNDAQARTTSERLPTYFGLQLHREITEHADFFAPLTKQLSSGTAALNLEAWAWSLYRAQLVREPDRPLFDETFSLRQVFVPLRAVWKEKKKRGREEEDIPHKVSLADALTEWMDTGTRDDCLRVLSGDPGSGKSSCAKMWAAEVAERHPGWRVVFIPLHRFGYKGDIKESLKAFLKDEARIEVDLLDRHSPDRVLLFFDGLDELAMEGSSARQAANAFVRHVNSMLQNHNRDDRRLLVVLGGRLLVVQDCHEELRKPNQILHLEGYSDEEKALWWHGYGVASGKGYASLPKELQRKELDELTSQPLLSYLIALSYGRGKLDFSKPITVNAIYADLLENVYERVWGEGGNIHLQGRKERLTQEEFEEVLEEIGVAVWHEDSRSATLEAIRIRCEAAGLIDSLKKLEPDADAGVFRLLTAFHVKFTSGRESSVEFTHKSFGEYLAARRIVHLVDEILEQMKLRKAQRRKGWDAFQSLIEWAKLCGPQPLDASDLNLFHLLTNEVASQEESQRESWRLCLIEMIEEFLANGMPMEQCGLASYREMDIQARNAEEALFSTLYTCLTPEIPKQPIEAVNSAPQLIPRWHFRRRFERWQLAYACVSSLNHLGFGLAFTNLQRAFLLLANLQGADLQGADLRGTILQEANLQGTILQLANLHGAYLQLANLQGAYLEGADLRGARLQGAYLQGADLHGAYLQGANLQGAYLEGADLRGARLQEASLEGAYLEGAKLQGADLTAVIGLEPRVLPESEKSTGS